MKATAVAPANIAFIKYWGKRDEDLRLPLNSSISMNLSNCITTTTVEFSKDFSHDEVVFLGALTNATQPSTRYQRVVKQLDLLRQRAGVRLFAKVATRNDFPIESGIASSAAGLAALTVAAVGALGLKLSEKELSILARLGSGSACRSIPDGFVQWQRGKDSHSSFAQSLYPADYWDLRDSILVVSEERKKTGSTAGMERARTSPFFGRRLRDVADRLREAKRALAQKDIERLGAVIEEDCMSMHAVTITQKPPVVYWSGATVEIVKAVHAWRSEGVPVFFTIDAGPNVHLIYEAKEEAAVLKKVREITGIKRVIGNNPSQGARTVTAHLF